MLRFTGKIFVTAVMLLPACSKGPEPLPRAAGSAEMDQAFAECIEAMKEAGDLHSMMVLQHGNIIEERQIAPDTAHFMMSVSKTFTSTAVGFAIEEGLLRVDDKIVDIWPEKVPADAQEALGRITVRHLLTMNSGHGKDPTNDVWRAGSDGFVSQEDWIEKFMAWPIEYEPGSCFCYNSLGTYLLSAAVQKVSGQKVVDYLEPRLWRPLGIRKPHWDESPAGINCGGWGLYLHTEDMARMGLCLLQGGKFNGKQVIPAAWVREMSAGQVESSFAGINSVEARQRQTQTEGNDWMQGYGYQMWRCTHNAFRADGAYGQYIIVIPDKDAVIVTTAKIDNMFLEIHLIWKYIYPNL